MAAKNVVKKKWLTWENTNNTLKRKGRLKMYSTFTSLWNMPLFYN